MSEPTTLACPQCGSAELNTLEVVFCTAECDRITTNGPEFSGYTNYDGGDQETTGVVCTSCNWQYEGADWLTKLVPTADADE